MKMTPINKWGTFLMRGIRKIVSFCTRRAVPLIETIRYPNNIKVRINVIPWRKINGSEIERKTN